MGDRSAIEWTDASWNPLAAFDRETGKRGWFCTRVSDGCKNCYAAALNQRLGTGHDYQIRNLEKIEFRLVNLEQPLRWTRPRRIFVNSMTDLFHEAVPDEFIDQVFAVMALARRHIFQALTKRPARMAEYMVRFYSRATPPGALFVSRATAAIQRYLEDELSLIADDHPRLARVHDGGWRIRVGGNDGPIPNVWLGTSVEDQAAADERIPHLLRTPAAVRFLSAEPLLGPVDLARAYPGAVRHYPLAIYREAETVTERYMPGGLERTRPGLGLVKIAADPAIHWVIAGGESGPCARPMDLAWARSLVEQCRAAGVPVFCKQLGARPCDIGAGRWQHHQIDGHEERLYIHDRHAATVWGNGTWHTWDAQGVGGENGRARDAEAARQEAERAVVRQGWHGLNLRDKKGGDPAEWPEDLRVREYPATAPRSATPAH